MKGRTYRYMTAEPMYPFGFGLSYTKFTYSDLKLSKTTIKKTEPVTATLTVTNSGRYAGEEVVQLYMTHEDVKGIATPLYSLKGFKRISVAPGASVPVQFTLTPDMLTIVDNNGKSILPAGKIKLSIGGSLPGSRSEALGASRGVEAVIMVK
jgi:beta-glucosidase